MKANRGDIEGMVLIARQEAADSGQPIYLVSTYNGYAREFCRPRNKCLRVDPNGAVWQMPEQTSYPIPGAPTEPQLLAPAAA